MEILLVLGLVGWVGYSLFKGNTRRGIETVRAHVFLVGLLAGDTVLEANRASLYDVANGPTEIIQNAIAHLRGSYGGKQKAMIADAYSKGMKSRLQFWYRTILVRKSAVGPLAS